MCSGNTEQSATFKNRVIMAKTLTVHVLYGDKKDLTTVISRLVENDFLVYYSGEYLYSSTSWDWFLDTYCQDIKDRLHPCVEKWSEQCVSGMYEGTESDTEVSMYKEGDPNPICKVYTYPCYINKFTEQLSKLCRIASTKGTNIQFSVLPKKF